MDEKEYNEFLSIAISTPLFFTILVFDGILYWPHSHSLWSGERWHCPLISNVSRISRNETIINLEQLHLFHIFCVYTNNSILPTILSLSDRALL